MGHTQTHRSSAPWMRHGAKGEEGGVVEGAKGEGGHKEKRDPEISPLTESFELNDVGGRVRPEA